eukprot:scaffold698237_cov79-Attheya_sp.AAC.2
MVGSIDELGSIVACGSRRPGTRHGLPVAPAGRALDVRGSKTDSWIPLEGTGRSLTFQYDSEEFVDLMIRKFLKHVTDEEIERFCDRYNTKMIPENVLFGYDVFFGALKIQTMGMESCPDLFRVLKRAQYTEAITFAKEVNQTHPTFFEMSVMHEYSLHQLIKWRWQRSYEARVKREGWM